MSERNRRWRVQASRERQKHRPLQRPPRWITSPRTSPRRSGKQQHYYSPKPVKILKRCLSEPMMLRSGGDGGSEGEDGQRRKSLWGETDNQGRVLSRPHTCTDVCSDSLSSLMAFSPWRQSFEGYNQEAKVVINVTVEGSPGPVKTMVKLGSSVEDTIKIVAEKYGEEARTPRLDRDAASSYELHHSHFSLQCLDKSELIGELGSRSFYLRRSGRNSPDSNGESHPFTSRFVQVKANAPPPFPFPPFLLPSFIARKLGKVVRRTRKIWKIVVCWQ